MRRRAGRDCGSCFCCSDEGDHGFYCKASKHTVVAELVVKVKSFGSSAEFVGEKL